MLHRYSSSAKPRNGAHNQRQAIWRNAETAMGGAKQFIFSSWAWRRCQGPSISIFLPGILHSLLVFALFGVAEIFSSRVTTVNAPNEVLLSGNRCRIVITDEAALGDLDLARAIFQPYHTKTLQEYLNYAVRCYGQDTNSDSCQKFYAQQLSFSIETNASCPFDDKLCLSLSDNLVLDTGYIESGKHLGFNAPQSDSFQYRMRTHCAPLRTEGYMEGHTPSTTDSNNQRLPVARCFYGKSTLPEGTFGMDGITTNNSFTYQVPINYSTEGWSSISSAPIDYFLQLVLPTSHLWTFADEIAPPDHIRATVLLYWIPDGLTLCLSKDCKMRTQISPCSLSLPTGFNSVNQ